MSYPEVSEIELDWFTSNKNLTRDSSQRLWDGDTFWISTDKFTMVWNIQLRGKWWIFLVAEQVSLIKHFWVLVSCYLLTAGCALTITFLSKHWLNCSNLIRCLMLSLLVQQKWVEYHQQITLFALYCPKVPQLENVASYLFIFPLELDWQFFLPDWKRRHQGIVLKPEDMYIIVKHLSALCIYIYIASKNIAGTE